MRSEDMRRRVLELVEIERARLAGSSGFPDYEPPKWIVRLLDEVGEACHSALDGRHDRYWAGMIRSAAVVIAALECHARWFGVPDDDES